MLFERIKEPTSSLFEHNFFDTITMQMFFFRYFYVFIYHFNFQFSIFNLIRTCIKQVPTVLNNFQFSIFNLNVRLLSI